MSTFVENVQPADWISGPQLVRLGAKHLYVYFFMAQELWPLATWRVNHRVRLFFRTTSLPTVAVYQRILVVIGKTNTVPK